MERKTLLATATPAIPAKSGRLKSISLFYRRVRNQRNWFSRVKWLAEASSKLRPKGRRIMKRSTGNSLAGWLAAALGLAAGILSATDLLAADPPEPWLHPYTGPTRSDIDATTLDGKVLCGYQGWFNTPGDGTNFGFTHWGQGLDRPGGRRFTVDMWPDVSEYDPADLREVPGLKMPDGSPARLYSAFRKGPVLLHAKWMRQYGIDGVFLSRFIGEPASPTRVAARQHGAGQRPRRVPPRGPGLGDDARPLDGPQRARRRSSWTTGSSSATR